eukprot:TRINITY_DN22975_c0_g1_i1.p1 TRINITY_DN22975_c0_g1~~TRINITY_DN22975_c0_g1_i1.p1  ORF type:complete len:312 (+),score=65.86 TRINITY_DN22975_c0_g1_i1:68-1003(+)
MSDRVTVLEDDEDTTGCRVEVIESDEEEDGTGATKCQVEVIESDKEAEGTNTTNPSSVPLASAAASEVPARVPGAVGGEDQSGAVSGESIEDASASSKAGDGGESKVDDGPEVADAEEPPEPWDEERVAAALKQANEEKAQGNEFYKRRQFAEALDAYRRAIDAAPPDHEQRAIFHSNAAACNVMLEDWDAAIEDCTVALKHDPKYMKALKRRAKAYEKAEKPDLALEDLKKILELDPADRDVRKDIVRVEPLAQAKFERDKEEMMGKLKDLGNSVLGMFGMSLDNFQMQQDPDTGSYSIGMKNGGGGSSK